jgi:hypothetical protein
MLFFYSHSIGQSLPIKDLVSLYEKDSSQLQNYFESIGYPYLKFYNEKYLEFVDTENHINRWFTDSNKVIKNEIASIDDIYPILFYRFNNIEELNDCKKNILKEGFVFDSIRTAKLNIIDTNINVNSGDSIQSYTMGNIEIQLSDTNFKKSIKVFNATAPMSAYDGQDVHMYAIIIRQKEY